VLIIGFLGYINLTGNRYSEGFGEESSAAGRLVLWQAGAFIALDNPLFGIGEGKFIEYSQLYSSEVEQSNVVRIENVLGKAVLVYWPFSDWMIFKNNQPVLAAP